MTQTVSSLPQSVPRLGLDSFRMCVSKLFFVGKQRKIFLKIFRIVVHIRVEYDLFVGLIILFIYKKIKKIKRSYG